MQCQIQSFNKFSFYYYSRDDIVQYINTHYKGPRMVLAGAGGVNHEELCDLATKHFGKITDKYDAEVPLDLAMRYTGKFVVLFLSEEA